jgi:hypothetical protein
MTRLTRLILVATHGIWVGDPAVAGLSPGSWPAPH